MKALSFGEILWDIDGDVKTLGGAPLNVLGHISKLGGDCSVISAVGDDNLGKETLAAIDGLGIDRRFVSISAYETGKALVALKDGIPSYSFPDPSAWDDIKLSDGQMEILSGTAYDVFIYGTLASRHNVSRGTLFSLLDGIKASEFFFDVNLRLSFYSAELIEECLRHATILKLNNDEVPIVSSLLGMNEGDFPYEVQRRFPVRKVLISLGSKGSVCFDGSTVINAEAGKVKVVDTVGAGDSLSAAFLYFLCRGDDTAAALAKASALADYVVTKRGAIPDYDESIRRRLNS